MASAKVDIDATIPCHHAVETEVLASYALCRDPSADSNKQLKLTIRVYSYVANRRKVLDSLQINIRAAWNLCAEQEPGGVEMMSMLSKQLEQLQLSQLTDMFYRIIKLAENTDKDTTITGEISHLNELIHLFGFFVVKRQHSAAHWNQLVSRLYSLLQKKVTTEGETDDNNGSATFLDLIAREGLISIKQDHLLDYFTDRLEYEYLHAGLVVYLPQAITLLRSCIDFGFETSPYYGKRIKRLGLCFESQFRLSRSETDLNNAILYLNQSFDRDPPLTEMCLDSRYCLARLLRLRSSMNESNGIDADLDRAIEVLNGVVEMTSEDDPKLCLALASLAKYMSIRFQQHGDTTDLERSVDLLIKAANRSSTLDLWQGTLQEWKSQRFRHTKPLEDLDHEIKLFERSIDSDFGRHVYEFGLALLLWERSEITDSVDDLHRAIELATRFEGNEDTQDASFYYYQLSRMFRDRHVRLGSVDDLGHAIHFEKMSTDTNLHNLPHSGRVEEIHDTSDEGNLDQVISRCKASITGASFSDRTLFKIRLSSLLLQRHTVTGSREDLVLSMELEQDLLHLLQHVVAPDPILLGELWISLGSKAKRLAIGMGGSLQEVEYAIDCFKKGLFYIPLGHHHERHEVLLNMDQVLLEKCRATGSMEDRKLILPYLIEYWRCKTYSTHPRIRIVRLAINLSEGLESYELLREAIEEIPKLCLRSFSNNDKQEVVGEMAKVASNAAYYHLKLGNSPASALELLESGRTVMSNVLMEMRVDTTELEDRYPDLAARFKLVTDRLDFVTVPDEAPVSMDRLQHAQLEENSRMRREADKEFPEIIEEIRSKSGFEAFLSTMTGSDFMAAADPNPIVVINMTPDESDAFLVESHRIRVLNLPDASIFKAQDELDELKSRLGSSSYNMRPLLEWLWISICNPCLQELGFSSPPEDNNWRRVWWIPTGPLCQLPLHAAGIHEPGSTDSVLDRVMSSYAPSLQALIHGQRSHRSRREHTDNRPALLVSMHHTPGQITLPHAEREIATLYNLCPALNLNPIRPECRKPIILEHIRQCLFFHFAGHGESNSIDPSSSYLLLDDWQTNRLTIADIRGLKLHRNPPFFAYLSACSTGSNEERRLADEGVHLIGAFQLAGFRHIIGTLWSVSDQHSADIAETVYETLLREGITDRAVCMGLHEAVRKLRHQQLEEAHSSRAWKWPVGESAGSKSFWGDQHWVPYIHFGV